MKNSLNKIKEGYRNFRQKYATGDQSIMQHLADHGQKPEIMVIACCDSRVDPSLILQCEPGDLFTIRNVANIIPPYESDDGHHGTSAALEFGVCYLNVKHLIILGHSQCGGINALIHQQSLKQNDFITRWVSIIEKNQTTEVEELARQALTTSYHNCLTFPWIKERVGKNQLAIHRWFFNISEGSLYSYSKETNQYEQIIV